MENWKVIPDFPKYEICEDGRVRSNMTKAKKIMATRFHYNKMYVKLTNNGINKSPQVHMLVAQLFLENPNNYRFVRFIDSNSKNLHVSNLEWCESLYPSNENWEPMKGNPNYEICPTGIRRSDDKLPIKISYSEDDYPIVKVWENKHRSNRSFHVLLAKQYLNPPDDPRKTIVNHKDGNKKNFTIENLEWVTEKRNYEHAVETGLKEINNGKGRHMEILTEDLEVIETFTSLDLAAQFLGVSPPHARKKIQENIYGDETAIINGHIVRYKVHESLEGEHWRKLKTNFADVNKRYEVSSLGRVRVVETTHIINPWSHNEYKSVNLQGDNMISHNFKVARLVAFAFLPFEGDQDHYQVDHINKKPSENNVENLQIMSKIEHMRKDMGRKILGLSRVTNRYVIFDSIIEATETLQLASTSSITGAMKRNGTAGKDKYEWYYYESGEALYITENYEQEQFQIDGTEYKPVTKPKVQEAPKAAKQIIITNLPKINKSSNVEQKGPKRINTTNLPKINKISPNNTNF